MPFIETFLAGLAVRGAYDATKGGSIAAYKKLKEDHSNIVDALSNDDFVENDTERNKYVENAIKILAGCGIINLSGGNISALGNTTFNHETGDITIGGTYVKAQSITTGGENGSNGTTLIKDGAELRTNGTSIRVGSGCEIRISGNAKIIQS